MNTRARIAADARRAGTSLPWEAAASACWTCSRPPARNPTWSACRNIHPARRPMPTSGDIAESLPGNHGCRERMAAGTVATSSARSSPAEGQCWNRPW
jgi:hypothetical protein